MVDTPASEHNKARVGEMSQLGLTMLSQDLEAALPQPVQKPGEDPLQNLSTSQILQRQIELHTKADQSQSILDKAVSAVFSPLRNDNETLSRLNGLYERARSAEQSQSALAQGALRQEVLEAVKKDEQALATRGEFEHYGGGFLKTTSLFLQRRTGMVASIATHALSEVRPHDSAWNQGADLVLGSAKGAGLKYMFGKATALHDVNPAFKGATLGFGSRAIDLGLSRQSYLNPQTGESSLAQGWQTLKAGALNKEAILADAIVFTAAGAAFAGVNRFSGSVVGKANVIKDSPFLSTVLTGSTFGLSSGAYGEYSRQRQAGEEFDFGKIMKRAGLQAAIDSIAAAPGGVQVDVGVQHSLKSAYTRNVSRVNSAWDNFMAGRNQTAAREPLLAAVPGGAEGKATSMQFGAMELAQRSSAWHRAAKSSEGNEYALASSIKVLPPEERIGAFRVALEKFPNPGLRHSVSSIPAADAAQAISLILGKTNGSLQRQLLGLVNPGTTVGELKSSFEAAYKAPGETLPEIRKWWQSLSGGSATGASVREQLSQQLDAKFLSRLLFEGRANELGEQLARQHPDMVKFIAQRTVSLEDAGTTRAMDVALQTWLSTKSIERTVQSLVELGPEPHPMMHQAPLMDVVGEISRLESGAARQRTLKTLADSALAPYSLGSERNAATAYELAAAVGKADPAAFKQHFLDPLQQALTQTGRSGDWQTFTLGRLAALERNGIIPGGSINLPRQTTDLLPGASGEKRAEVRTAAEKSLGTSRGGSPEDQHLLGLLKISDKTQLFQSLQQARGQSGFDKLAPSEQTNLLWTVAIRHSAQKLGLPETQVADYAASVLSSLSYSVPQGQRVLNLIHASRPTGFSAIEDHAAFLRHPGASSQMEILSKVLGVAYDAKAAAPIIEQMNEVVVPVLTSELPRGFGLHRMQPGFAVFGHTTGNLENGTFFRQLGLFESTHNSTSASLLKPGHFELFDPQARIVPIVAAPPEQVSQAHRGSIWTGSNVGRQGHVRQTLDWAQSQVGQQFAAEMNAKLSLLGYGKGGQSGRYPALEEYRQELSKYGTLDQLLHEAGKDSRIAKAHSMVQESYVRYQNGTPIDTYNEFKISSPRLVGLGVFARGQSVALEGNTQFPRIRAEDFGIPESIWREALKLNLPLVVLD